MNEELDPEFVEAMNAYKPIPRWLQRLYDLYYSLWEWWIGVDNTP